MIKNIVYKGYTADIQHDKENKYWFGKILYINDLITCGGSTLKEFEADFKDVVDDYINTCKELGRLPQIPSPSIKESEEILNAFPYNFKGIYGKPMVIIKRSIEEDDRTGFISNPIYA